ncbi:MAG TPA: hypothetical protein VFS08_17195 [Gemmatimonadaceae bacterium]|nr:hypothetical protein [Gemmatimonadaceae bacterium]
MASLLDEISRRTPRSAAGRVRIGTPHARSCYLSYVRLSGPREDVLDHAAYLLAHDPAHDAGHQPGTAPMPLELIAIESETDEELSIIFSRSLYNGE